MTALATEPPAAKPVDRPAEQPMLALDNPRVELRTLDNEEVSSAERSATIERMRRLFREALAAIPDYASESILEFWRVAPRTPELVLEFGWCNRGSPGALAFATWDNLTITVHVAPTVLKPDDLTLILLIHELGHVFCAAARTCFPDGVGDILLPRREPAEESMVEQVQEFWGFPNEKLMIWERDRRALLKAKGVEDAREPCPAICNASKAASRMLASARNWIRTQAARWYRRNRRRRPGASPRPV